CVCGKKIGPDPRNFNQRVSLGRNDLLIRTFPKQKYGHYGLGVDQHQKIDNYTMGLNSWKIAPNERGDKKGVPGLSCFQPH
ncbi:DUF4049 domain-containing protein, partial [Escherichia coli]